MSSRQTKKSRKGRNNPNNRERTVTTLTEDPNTPYLVPTPSEEPAGATLMSSPFSVASSSAGNAASASAYQPPSNYAAFGYNNSFSTPIHGQVHPQQQQPQFYPQQQQQQTSSQLMLPPGANDLELLENLKEIIKAGQHNQFQHKPQPGALASLYLGHIPPVLAQAIHPEKAQYGNVTDGSSQANATASGPSSPVDLGRRPPRLQSKEIWDTSGQRKPVVDSTAGGPQLTNNANQASYDGRLNPPSAINVTNLHVNGKTDLAGPPSASFNSTDVHMSDAPSVLAASSAEALRPASPRPSRFEPSNARPVSDQNRPGDRPGHGESGYGGPRGPGNVSPVKTSFDSKDDLRRDGSWSARDGPLASDDRRRELDRPLPSPRSAVNGNGSSSDARSNAGDRHYDRDNRDRDRDRDFRDRRDWDRDRRPYDRFRSMSDARRPPPEQRHYEPDYDRNPLPRRHEIKEEPISDTRRLLDLRPPPVPTVDDRASLRPVDDRHPPAASRVPPTIDSRGPVESHPDSWPPPPDSRAPPARGPSFDDRKPPFTDERRAAPLPADDRVPPAAARPADNPGASGRPTDDRTRDVTVVPKTENRSSERPQVPLEERISRPSLQERLNQPPASRPEPLPIVRQASLEERLSAIPVSVDSREQQGRVPDRGPPPPPPRSGPPLDDRSAGRSLPPPPSAGHDERRIDDRPAPGRYGRAPSPPPERATYHSGSIRDDPRAVKGPLAPVPPSPRSAPRDYRAPTSGRPISRERAGASYRPDYNPDDRRPEPMDVDAPSRYSDTRTVPYNRPFSPPSAADLARDRDRARQFPPSPPPRQLPLDAPPYDDDRRYPLPQSGRGDWYQPYGADRRREWSAADEDYYKSRQWDRGTAPLPPSSSASDRDRFDREPPRSHGWDARDERDRRDFQRAPSPSRYDPSPRPLSSRLTDSFGGPPPPPSSDRGSYAPPPPSRDAQYSRVRPRSPSPARRPGGQPLEDNRPPVKRSREDAYAPDFYPPPSSAQTQSVRDPGPPRGGYPPLSRGNSPPPSSGASSYFDRSGPPPSSGGTATGDRPDYAHRGDYPPATYERPRSPPGARGYGRGGAYVARDARDDRRYPPPPPPQAMLPPRRP
ncbi:hypothetical protein DXG03_006384 [Asterophora parasitica]|uniref:Uncharacterized protein n=1 Tax=Asterophora parasitica TaxID=117018 RepID=A0A9P7K9J8_9AGAR|nr:hypothetical protein DXG03_006384 [Asterophora parasitica]